MTFKKLVKAINEIETEEDMYKVFGLIDRSFDTENKISFEDHELLYSLASKMA